VQTGPFAVVMTPAGEAPGMIGWPYHQPRVRVVGFGGLRGNVPDPGGDAVRPRGRGGMGA